MELDSEKKKLILACSLVGLAVIVIAWNFWPSGGSSNAGAGAAPVVPSAPGAPGPRQRIPPSQPK